LLPHAVPTGATKQGANETETVIENGSVFASPLPIVGAQVKSWILKKFDNETQKWAPLDLVNPGGRRKVRISAFLCGHYDEGPAQPS